MRISFVLSSLQLSGGVILVVELANRLAALGHTVYMVTPRQSTDASIMQKIHPTVTVVESRARVPAGFNPFRLVWLVWSLVRAAPPSDVFVATHTPTTLPVLLVSWLRRRARLWLYMDYEEMFRARPVEQALFRYAPGWFPAIVAISQPLVDEVRTRTRGQVTLLRPGLGLTTSKALANTSSVQQTDGWRILYIGDDRPRKGLCEFVQAMELVQAQEPDALAVIVCKNTYRINKNIQHELHIHPSDDTLATLYHDCDLFVSTSWSEGLGYPALQAMSFGKPVIVTDSGGVRDYAVDGVNALLVPAKNARAVAEAIMTLLRNEPLRMRLQIRGQQVAALYNWETATATLTKVLETLTQVKSK